MTTEATDLATPQALPTPIIVEPNAVLDIELEKVEQSFATGKRVWFIVGRRDGQLVEISLESEYDQNRLEQVAPERGETLRLTTGERRPGKKEGTYFPPDIKFSAPARKREIIKFGESAAFMAATANGSAAAEGESDDKPLPF